METVDQLKIRVEFHGSRLRQKSAVEKKVRYAVGHSTRRRVSVRRRECLVENGLFHKNCWCAFGVKKVVFIECFRRILYRRGWRTHVSQAPIRENLAVAMLAFRNGIQASLVDPMVVLGHTIEAGCIAYEIAPGASYNLPRVIGLASTAKMLRRCGKMHVKCTVNTTG